MLRAGLPVRAPMKRQIMPEIKARLESSDLTNHPKAIQGLLDACLASDPGAHHAAPERRARQDHPAGAHHHLRTIAGNWSAENQRQTGRIRVGHHCRGPEIQGPLQARPRRSTARSDRRAYDDHANRQRPAQQEGAAIARTRSRDRSGRTGPCGDSANAEPTCRPILIARALEHCPSARPRWSSPGATRSRRSLHCARTSSASTV